MELAESLQQHEQTKVELAESLQREELIRLQHAKSRVNLLWTNFLSVCKKRIGQWRSKRIIANSGQFDSQAYLAENPDVGLDKRLAKSPLKHYIRHGVAEGRSPRAGFDSDFYLAQNPVAKNGSLIPLAHYIACGFGEGHSPCQGTEWFGEWLRFQRPRSKWSLRRQWRIWKDFWRIHRSRLFVGEWYCQEHPDVFNGISTMKMSKFKKSRFGLLRNLAKYLCHPIRHYLIHGVYEGRRPSGSFDINYYLARNPDVRVSGQNPFAHYCSDGAREGRLGRGTDGISGTGGIGLHFTRKATYTPKVSVIVPNYNHVDYLRQRLDSIYSQTYSNIEVILMDDCSTDDSRAILDQYAARYPDITKTAYNETNSGGVFRQWAKGIGLATGELIWIAESDDFCDETFLACLAPNFRDETVMLAYSRYAFAGSDGSPIPNAFENYVGAIDRQRWLTSYVETALNETSLALGVQNTIPNASGAVFRRPQDMELLKNEDWLGMKIAGDWLFYLHIIVGGKIVYSVDSTSYFRLHDNNTAKHAPKDPAFYREIGKIARTIPVLYNVPAQTLKRARDLWFRMYMENIGRSEEEFDALYKYDQVLAAQSDRLPSIMVSMIGFASGGAEIIPIRIANEFKRQGLPVLLHCADALPYEDKIREMVRNDIPVLRTFDTAVIRRAIREFGVEVLNSHHLDIQRCILRDPNVFSGVQMHAATLHGMIEHPDFGVTKAQLVQLDQNVDVWVFTAEKNAEPFRKAGLFNASSHFIKLPNGMAPPQVEPITRQELDLPEDAFVLCCVSRAIPDKGWEEAIEVIEKARSLSGKDIRLILVGNGPVHDEYCRKGYPDYIKMVGFHENSVGHYAAADMGMMLTKFRAESFPLTVLDSLFVGKPYIASDIGEIRAMLTTDDGVAGAVFKLDNWSIPVNDVARIVADFATSPQRCAQAAALAPKAAERFRIDVLIERYLAIFAQRDKTGSANRILAQHRLSKAPSLRKQAAEIRESDVFDDEFYHRHYPDISTLPDPLMHYLKHGCAEGRMPNDWFDAQFVEANCPAISDLGANPLWYYARYLHNIPGILTHSDMHHKGSCPVCQQESIFRAHTNTIDSYNHLRCITCNSAPRDRALRMLLDEHAPDWRKGHVHESSPSNDCIKSNVQNYSASQFYTDRPLGSMVNGFGNENLEDMTFSDNTFDVIVAVDVVEHVFHPDRMVKEMLRVVKPGGIALFTTVPNYSLEQCRPRATVDENTGRITELSPPIYHGNPIADGALMTWDFGRDFNARIEEWAGCKLIHWSQADTQHGVIPGGIPHIYLLKKPEKGNSPPIQQAIDANSISFYETDYYRQFDTGQPFSKETKGFCPVCKNKTTFSSKHPWLRDNYLCGHCGSTPRQRHLQHLLRTLVPGWESMAVHECSPINDFISRDATGYSSSHYYPNEETGKRVGDHTNEDLENLTFAPDTFDVFVSQDVLEHVFSPQQAIREMLRVTAPGGVVIFTIPMFRGGPSLQRAERSADGRVRFLHQPVHHGNPVDPSGSLAVWDFGDDFPQMLQIWAGDCDVAVFDSPIPELGIEGDLIEVFYIRKSPTTKTHVPKPLKTEQPAPAPPAATSTGPYEATVPHAICYLHIDMNVATPIAAVGYFWDKFVRGANKYQGLAQQS